MNEIRVFLEIKDFGVDENGERRPMGLQVSLGEIEEPMDYTELTEDINIPGILQAVALDQVVKPEQVNVISPEEFAARYGDEERENG